MPPLQTYRDAQFSGDVSSSTEMRSCTKNYLCEGPNFKDNHLSARNGLTTTKMRGEQGIFTTHLDVFMKYAARCKHIDLQCILYHSKLIKIDICLHKSCFRTRARLKQTFLDLERLRRGLRSEYFA